MCHDVCDLKLPGFALLLLTVQSVCAQRKIMVAETERMVSEQKQIKSSSNSRTLILQSSRRSEKNIP